MAPQLFFMPTYQLQLTYTPKSYVLLPDNSRPNLTQKTQQTSQPSTATTPTPVRSEALEWGVPLPSCSFHGYTSPTQGVLQSSFYTLRVTPLQYGLIIIYAKNLIHITIQFLFPDQTPTDMSIQNVYQKIQNIRLNEQTFTVQASIFNILVRTSIDATNSLLVWLLDASKKAYGQC